MQRKIRVIFVVIALLVGGYLYYQNSTSTSRDIEFGLVYTSGCTIGNIRNENPTQFDTLEKQIEYCNAIQENTSGIFLYDFATEKSWAIPEHIRNNTDLITFPKNILGSVKTTSQEAMLYTTEEIEIPEFDVDGSIISIEQLQCKVENLERTQSKIRCTLQTPSEDGLEYSTKQFSFGRGELVKPHFFLKRSDLVEYRARVIKCGNGKKYKDITQTEVTCS